MIWTDDDGGVFEAQPEQVFFIKVFRLRASRHFQLRMKTAGAVG